LRKCINFVQQNCQDNRLIGAKESDAGTADYRIQMVELFKAGKINEARKVVCGNARPEEMDDVYRWLYDNVSVLGDEATQDKAILIIKQGLVDHALVMDPEINLAATMIRLSYL
jgi:hypothetical protein